MLLIPDTLHTDRLILRRPAEADRAAYVAFYTSDRSSMAMGPKSPEDASAFFDLDCGLWDEKGFGMYSLFAKAAPDTPIGLVGVWHPDICAEPELGWLLWEGAEGKGYAMEAAQACLTMWRGIGKPNPISYITEDNTPSQRVARRLGAHIEGTHPDHPHLKIWRHGAVGFTHQIPTLRTDRLTLGPATQAHLDAMTRFGASDRSKWFRDFQTPKHIWNETARHLGHWAMQGFGPFWITETAPQTPAGIFAIWHPEGRYAPGLFWILFEGAEGKGYAAEAGRAIARWTLDNTDITEATSHVEAANTRSMALAKRLGGVFDGVQTRDNGTEYNVFRHKLKEMV